MNLNKIKVPEELTKEFQQRYLDLMKKFGYETECARTQANQFHNELNQLEESFSKRRNIINHNNKLNDINRKIELLQKEKYKIEELIKSSKEIK